MHLQTCPWGTISKAFKKSTKQQQKPLPLKQLSFINTQKGILSLSSKIKNDLLRPKMKYFHKVCVKLRDSQCSRTLIMNVTIESAHCAYARNGCRKWTRYRDGEESRRPKKITNKKNDWILLWGKQTRMLWLVKCQSMILKSLKLLKDKTSRVNKSAHIFSGTTFHIKEDISWVLYWILGTDHSPQIKENWQSFNIQWWLY